MAVMNKDNAVMDLTGRLAIVTGGSRGQGEAEARLLARAGAAVLIADVLEAEGRALAKTLTAEGRDARFATLDVAQPESWAALMAEAAGWKGRLDVLVNNAGIINRSSVSDTTLDGWNRLLGINLTGTFLGIQAAAPLMRATGGGSIVNIASNSAFSGHYDPAYTASKWGVRGLTRTAAMEYVTWGIRVNSVCPGLIVTGLNANASHLAPMIGLTPMGRSGTPDEVAQLVLFLASDASSFITGEDFTIDGGFTAGAAYRRVAVESGLLPPPIDNG
ncbi:NAD(P)-dependent dehydrogenase, short-chain alcohol dehydrogenase family [Kaistia soli DSM 19436]|uniref:NAD(P)-dependent dehydrogenase, short-chain alcohol dehydrogenase family n=1 Tax=Kaistia soli DSM 19436 TaxID=1122133 RepID=A0A1M5EC27_9HYPH|nr:SDR family oxidoreductase [Kaistia soli]SHF76710.1 NAD(P)-dependent dehydrogenase, short-chain alcohol dehydrogenase family [Kaistia soli DSM 19436]